jgi:predicted DNA-binding transcriptional regulator YafY
MSGIAITIDYANHRGERGLRRILPEKIEFLESGWHPDPQWILLAWDLEKDAVREFAMKDIHSWVPSK